ncbi:ankyrin repeat domain-containing protein 24-like [Scleropages formosus]|uniref:Ankyrin repeat domain-containing protein 24-like n=1 Tax=Scleropages formosus TaxID=113540 RepID=A0A0P7VFZ2_SCLFO|nr:ankyrin repeat domain-containing protein 24-like [Scleropages formosus]
MQKWERTKLPISGRPAASSLVIGGSGSRGAGACNRLELWRAQTHLRQSGKLALDSSVRCWRNTMKSLKAKFKKTESQDWSKSDERLLQAVEQNEPDKVAALLVKKGLCASKLDGEGKSAFHVSASRGRLDCLEVILSHNVDITSTDSNGFSVLHLAAKNGHPECLKRLLQERLPVDSTDSHGRTALHHAAVSGCLSCTEILWDFKACLDAQDGDGSTPLMLGAQMSRVELCAFLLDRGASADQQDSQGRSALMLACESDSAETVEVLLRGGATPHLTDALGRDATHYTIAGGSQHILRLLQDTGNPPAPPPLPGRGTPRKRKAPLPPSPPAQGSPPSPEPQSTPPPAQSPETQRTPPASLMEDEEVFEEIRRLRLERGRLLQKIKGLEQQQHSAHIALEEVLQPSHPSWFAWALARSTLEIMASACLYLRAPFFQLCLLQERLEQAEVDREQLLAEIEELRGTGTVILASDSEDAENMLDFPGAERLLSRRSRGSEPDSESTQDDDAEQEERNSSCTSQGQGNQEVLSALQRQVEELTAQNADLLLKVEMLENFEKDDTDIQNSGPDFVPTVLYDSLRKEFEELQERYFQAQAAAEASSVTGSIEKVEEEQGEGEEEDTGESAKELKEQLRGLEEQLRQSQTELDELREQVKVGVFSVEQLGDTDTEERAEVQSSDLQQLRDKVKELEEAVVKKRAEAESENDTSRQLREKVEELEAALAEKQAEDNTIVNNLRQRVSELEAALAEKQAERKAEEEGDGEQEAHVLQNKVQELQGELRNRVPRAELEEVQLTLGLQLEQLARERAEAAMRLNEALLELERLRPPPDGDGEEDEDEEEDRSESSERSITSGKYCSSFLALALSRELRAKGDGCLSKGCVDATSVQSESSVRISEGSTLAAVREQLEVARQEAAQALDYLCAEREGRAQDALQMKDAVPLSQHQEALSTLNSHLEQVAQELQRERALRDHAQQEISRMEAQMQSMQKDLISKEEHEKVKLALQRSLEESERSAQAAQDALSARETELKEVRSQRAAEQGAVSKEEHEAQRLSLQAEINALTAQLADLARKHEKTCTEVFQVQREALFNKSERQAAEAQLAAVQKQLADLQAQSSHVQELHKGIQESQGLVKEKDRKITELSKEIFRLKEALGALTPPLGLSSSGFSSQQVALQGRVTALTQQLKDWEQKHCAVVSVYRTHLLAAVQGRMDEEVQALLLQILRMTHEEQGH